MKPRVDLLVEALARILDLDLQREFPHDLKVTASDADIERLMTSDHPMAGYVISGLVAPEISEAKYNEWVNATLKRTDR